MPWWGKSQEPKPDQPTNATTSSPAKFDPDKLPHAEKLPKGLQKIVDKADDDGSFFDNIVEGLLVPIACVH